MKFIFIHTSLKKNNEFIQLKIIVIMYIKLRTYVFIKNFMTSNLSFNFNVGPFKQVNLKHMTLYRDTIRGIGHYAV